MWGRATVLDTCEVADNVKQIVLEPEKAGPAAPPGSHIDVGVYVNGRSDVRSYSVVSNGAYGSELVLGVQLARQSRGGSAYMHALRRGQEVSITQPLQNFPLTYGRPGYVLLAGGIGVTALVGMAKDSVLRDAAVIQLALVAVASAAGTLLYAGLAIVFGVTVEAGRLPAIVGVIAVVNVVFSKPLRWALRWAYGPESRARDRGPSVFR